MRQARAETPGSQVTEYLFPTSVREAIHILEHYDGAARIMAGGTDLLPEIREGKLQGTAHPRCVVDITRIPDLECPSCNEILGVIGKSKGGRWAFKMRKGFFHRKLIK